MLFIYFAAADLSCGIGDLLLLRVDSLIVAHGLQSTWASAVVACEVSSSSVACLILVLQPGIEPASPALQGDS